MAAKSSEAVPVENDRQREEGEVSWEYLRSQGVVPRADPSGESHNNSSSASSSIGADDVLSEDGVQIIIRYSKNRMGDHPNHHHGKNNGRKAQEPGFQGRAGDKHERSAFCRLHFLHGDCDYGSSCKYSHNSMRDTQELHRFFRDNESYLAEMYKNQKLGKFTYHFHEYLRKKSQADPEVLGKWGINLKSPGPPPMSLSELLGSLQEDDVSKPAEEPAKRSNQYPNEHQRLVAETNAHQHSQQGNINDAQVPTIIGTNGILPSLDPLTQSLPNIQLQNQLPNQMMHNGMMQFLNGMGMMPNPLFPMAQLQSPWMNPQLQVGSSPQMAANNTQYQSLLMMGAQPSLQPVTFLLPDGRMVMQNYFLNPGLVAGMMPMNTPHNGQQGGQTTYGTQQPQDAYLSSIAAQAAGISAAQHSQLSSMFNSRSQVNHGNQFEMQQEPSATSTGMLQMPTGDSGPLNDPEYNSSRQSNHFMSSMNLLNPYSFQANIAEKYETQPNSNIGNPFGNMEDSSNQTLAQGLPLQLPQPPMLQGLTLPPPFLLPQLGFTQATQIKAPVLAVPFQVQKPDAEVSEETKTEPKGMNSTHDTNLLAADRHSDNRGEPSHSNQGSGHLRPEKSRHRAQVDRRSNDHSRGPTSKVARSDSSSRRQRDSKQADSSRMKSKQNRHPAGKHVQASQGNKILSLLKEVKMPRDDDLTRPSTKQYDKPQNTQGSTSPPCLSRSKPHKRGGREHKKSPISRNVRRKSISSRGTGHSSFESESFSVDSSRSSRSRSRSRDRRPDQDNHQKPKTHRPPVKENKLSILNRKYEMLFSANNGGILQGNPQGQ